MRVLSDLEPKEVFHYFEQICSIPHPSYKEEKISDYCVSFAKERNLAVWQDELKNIIIIKDATPGYEKEEPIIIQGHMDMVCEKEADCDIDFEKDGLRLFIDGDYVKAKGTTLGGDDGIAVAYALAILDSDTIEHPKLEVIFTVCEEVGMEGATGIDVSMLQGRRLLNLDSEEEGYMLASCAGGCSAECVLPVTWEEKTGTIVTITVAGLMGGHSGVEIDKGRANSNLLMGRILLEAGTQSEISLVSLSGGTKDNAIPRETKASVLLDSKDVDAFVKEVNNSAKAIMHEYTTSDPDIKITVAKAEETTSDVLPKELTTKVILLITELPNGVQRMSTDITGLVETSLNLGVAILSKEKLSLRYSVRSSVQTAKESILMKMEALVGYFGGNIVRTGEYPAWEYKKDSKLREDMIRIFKHMYGKDPIIQAIHAGLECGILSGKLEGLDCISFGPNISDIHTTEEKLSISSTKRVWEYILEVLKCKQGTKSKE
jgi:dipeptidase D